MVLEVVSSVVVVVVVVEVVYEKHLSILSHRSSYAVESRKSYSRSSSNNRSVEIVEVVVEEYGRKIISI